MSSYSQGLGDIRGSKTILARLFDSSERRKVPQKTS